MSNTNRAHNGFEANVRRHTTLGVGLVVGLAYSNLDLNDVIAGDAVPAGDLEAELSSLGDPARVKKYYKHGDLECKQGVGTVEDAIVQRIGTRDVL